MSLQEKLSNKTVVRISKAISFIEENLESKLILEDIAKEAYFSPFHFHRLFKIVTTETVNDFITRKRVEKAASFLIHKREKTVTEIAETTGFTNLSSFSRAFKKFYGLSPVEFRKETPGKFSKICKEESKNGQVEVRFEEYICNIQNALNWIKMNANTEVKTVAEIQVAYISHQGRMDLIGDVYNRLMRWAIPKGLMNQPDLKMITIYHDSPKITDPNFLRMSACMTLNSKVDSEGEVNLKTLPATKCIVSRFEIRLHEFQQAWETSFVWMSEHGYKKADKDPFEIYYNNPNEHPEGKCIVDICIPIE